MKTTPTSFRAAKAPALAAALALLGCASAPAPTAKPVATERGRNLVLITVDGLRGEEIFGGLDEAVAGKAENSGVEYEEDLARIRAAYQGRGGSESRVALMPFFWTEFAPNGMLLGERSRGSEVRVTNREWFSAPGYIEILTGEPHHDVTSNDIVRYPYPSFMEFAKQGLDLGYTDVATIGSWEGFETLSSSRADLFFSNAGFEAVAPEYATERMRWLGEIQDDIITLWPGGRSDAVTYGMATEYLRRYKPRVLYIAFGETDDWAHQRRYDRYLDYIHVFDDYLRRLWELLQSMDEYRDNTTVIISTDHGRGSGHDWAEHDINVPGSEYIWIALRGPGVPHVGSVAAPRDVTQSDIAATALEALGLDYRDFNPRMGPPIPLDVRTPLDAQAPPSR